MYELCYLKYKPPVWYGDSEVPSLKPENWVSHLFLCELTSKQRENSLSMNLE